MITRSIWDRITVAADPVAVTGVLGFMLTGCGVGDDLVVDDLPPALVEMPDPTPQWMLDEIRQARADLVQLRGPGGEEYAAQWGMTRAQGIAQVTKVITVLSESLSLENLAEVFPDRDVILLNSNGDTIGSLSDSCTCAGPLDWFTRPWASHTGYQDNRGVFPYVYLKGSVGHTTVSPSEHNLQLGVNLTGGVSYDYFNSVSTYGQCKRNMSMKWDKMWKLDRDVDLCISVMGNHFAWTDGHSAIARNTRDDMCYEFRMQIDNPTNESSTEEPPENGCIRLATSSGNVYWICIVG